MFKLNKKAEGSVGTAIKLVISIVLGGAILFSTTAMVNNTVVPGMVNIFESEHSDGVTVSGDAISAEIDDAIIEHNEDESAHEELFDAKADLSALDSKADKSELAEKANLTDLNNLVTKSVLQSLNNDIALLRTQVTDPVSAYPELASLSARTDALETAMSTQTLNSYPVGSIYLSVSGTSPQTLFGGTWELLKDRFLLGAGDDYTAGSLGGYTGLQEHSHSIPALTGSTSSAGSHSHSVGVDKDVAVSSSKTAWSAHDAGMSGAGGSVSTSSAGNHTHTVTTNASTTGSAGNGASAGATDGNMPPYLVVYMWKRTA